jgi:ABC-type bacteriocin/lantibiotic exporter with double-glycine peptidase domain
LNFRNKEEGKIHKSFVRQQDLSDCGVACLLSITKYYNGNDTLENLRRLGGTNITGTTLLGLYQAAKKTGFSAEGCESNIDSLISYNKPCILNAWGYHYVVFFGVIQKKEIQFIIGDPARGILYLSEGELNELWGTKKCLELYPNNDFRTIKNRKRQKSRWIIALIKEDSPLLAIAVALGVAISILGLVMAIFSQKLIDEILPKKEFIKLNLGIALVFTLLLIKEALSVLRQYFLLCQSKDFNIRITDFFYTHLLKLPKPFFDTRKIGELTARLNDTARIQRVISQLAGNVVIDSLMAIVSTIFVFLYSWQVGLGCMVATPFFFMLIYLHNKRIIIGQRAIMTSYASTEANYISTLQGIEPIKNYNKQTLFSKTNKKIYQEYQINIFSLGKIQVKLSFLANGFGVTFLMAVLFFTSYEVLHGHLKTGQLMAILGMCGALLPSVANLALVSIPINEAKIAFDRMFEFTSAEIEKDMGEKQLITFDNLQVKNLTYRFPGRSPIIKDISFEVRKGEIIAIMGENGCGKSTLTQILLKHYANENGRIIINRDTNLNDFELTSWRKLVGCVPQNIHIFNGSVLENIAFDDAIDKPHEIVDFLKLYGFSPYIDNLPHSYMTILGEEGINLSGGQKQIIALARALYFKPQLLILDEATAAMDRLSEQFVLRLLQRLKKEMGIIFITHRLHVLKSFCDRINILENGVISNSGTHEQLLKTPNLYSLYWNDLIAQDFVAG